VLDVAETAFTHGIRVCQVATRGACCTVHLYALLELTMPCVLLSAARYVMLKSAFSVDASRLQGTVSVRRAQVSVQRPIVTHSSAELTLESCSSRLCHADAVRLVERAHTENDGC
jgi:hypothetical protein